MNKYRRAFLLLVLVCGIVASGFGPSLNEGLGRKLTSITQIVLEPCEVPGTRQGEKEKVLCGAYDVFENRATKRGRTIKIKIVVFPATGANKASDPLFYIPGGPGSSATEDAAYIAQGLAKIRDRRDLVFVDQRGTGGSNALNCDFFNSADITSYFGFYFPLADVRKCREQLESKADLKLYTTHIAMDELDEVRAGLGYQKINITAGSYGTRATQDYLKRYQKNVRAVVLQGISPTNQSMPLDFPQHTERALNGVVDECLENEPCRTAFPNLRADVKTVLARLLKGPVAVSVKHPQTAVSTPVELSRDLAGEAIRYMLYQSGAASRIPLFIHLAAEGNFTPLAESALFYRQQIVATGSNGMYLTVTCAEDLPRVRPADAERNGRNTFLGGYRTPQQQAACDLWPRADVPKSYADPTRSNVAALILTGQWDPVTPPVYGDTAAKHLPNSLHVVVPHGGHGFGGLDGLDCIQNLTADFIERKRRAAWTRPAYVLSSVGAFN